MAIYRRESGRYAVLIDVDRKADGARQRRTLGTYRTRKDAERAEREALAARDRGTDLAPGRITVGELLERYLDDRRALGRGEKTLERYAGIARFNLAPHVGSVALAKFRPAHVSELVATLRSRGGRDGRPLSPKTVKHAFALLKGALAWAVRQELVGRNVADIVTPPSVRRSDVTALSVDEAQRLLSVADGGRWGPFMRLALATGARRGELLALRWDDVDFELATLTIRASLSETRSGVTHKGTKTDRVRVVALAATALDALRRQRSLQAQERLAAGSAFTDCGHIFQGRIWRDDTTMPGDGSLQGTSRARRTLDEAPSRVAAYVGVVVDRRRRRCANGRKHRRPLDPKRNARDLCSPRARHPGTSRYGDRRSPSRIDEARVKLRDCPAVSSKAERRVQPGCQSVAI